MVNNIYNSLIPFSLLCFSGATTASFFSLRHKNKAIITYYKEYLSNSGMCPIITPYEFKLTVKFSTDFFFFQLFQIDGLNFNDIIQNYVLVRVAVSRHHISSYHKMTDSRQPTRVCR